MRPKRIREAGRPLNRGQANAILERIERELIAVIKRAPGSNNQVIAAGKLDILRSAKQLRPAVLMLWDIK